MRENIHFTEQESSDDSVQKHSFSEDGPRLTFGIHSLTLGGTSPEFVGPPENPVYIKEALSRLQVKGQPFLSRSTSPRMAGQLVLIAPMSGKQTCSKPQSACFMSYEDN
jgi:hypothetical protein